MVEITTGYVRWQSIVTEAIPTFILTSQSQRGDVSQLEAMSHTHCPYPTDSPTGINLCMCPANERRHYIVTSPLIGWAHTQNDPCPSSAAKLLVEVCNSRGWVRLCKPVQASSPRGVWRKSPHYKDHSGYGLSQWEEALQCNAFSHCIGWAHTQNDPCIAAPLCREAAILVVPIVVDRPLREPLRGIVGSGSQQGNDLH